MTEKTNKKTKKVFKITNEEDGVQVVVLSAYDEIKTLIDNEELKGFIFGAFTKNGDMITTTTETLSTIEDYTLACFMQNYFQNILNKEQEQL